MRRWLPKLALFVMLLVGGAIVNVAVAWGLSIRPISPSFSDVSPTESELRVFRVAGWVADDRGWEGYFLMQLKWQAWGFQWQQCTEIIGFRPAPSGKEYFSQVSTSSPIGYSLQCGWPAWSLAGIQMERRYDIDSTMISRERREGLLVISNHGVEMPTKPIWPGFAINTVFYAVTLWVLFAAPFALRRRRRIKRGLCPKCAYDLRGADSVACPECGARSPLLRVGSGQRNQSD